MGNIYNSSKVIMPYSFKNISLLIYAYYSTNQRYDYIAIHNLYLRDNRIIPTKLRHYILERERTNIKQIVRDYHNYSNNF